MEVTIDYEKLGLRIRQIRKEQKLTQEKLAELANLSSNYLGKIERSASVASIETLVKISNALKMPIGYFLQDSLVNLESDNQEKELISLFSMMTPKEKAFTFESIKLCKKFCQSFLDSPAE